MGTITAEVVDTGEKRDAKGRRVTPKERRAQMVQAFRASGMTMAAFARRERLNYATFAGWVAKSQRLPAAKRPIEFAELRMPFVAPVARLGRVGAIYAKSWERSTPGRAHVPTYAHAISRKLNIIDIVRKTPLERVAVGATVNPGLA